MQLSYSFIIPVFNRPDEVQELLSSLSAFTTSLDFEVVIVEDGSTQSSKDVVDSFRSRLNIAYFKKPNTGPGDSRNYGMQRAKGNYYIILDSDCIIPPSYLDAVHTRLTTTYSDCFGGPDAAHESFTPIQKAINYSMTSVLTTGGIRGNKVAQKRYEPRSFNMGISKLAFNKTGGFGKIHPGEDPDLSQRIKKLGFESQFIADAFVYHKRRISWSSFYKQVNKFGLVRPILSKWHPDSTKITFWFPTLFLLGTTIALVAWAFGFIWFALLLGIYFGLVFVHASIKNKSLIIGLLAIFATCVQFLGYGWGFIKSTTLIKWFGKDPKNTFPNLFFE